MTDAEGWDARRLLRRARVGTLATQEGGQPHASLVTPATTQDASVLLLLSGLSSHTRHLRADPRCALMVQGMPDGPNPQTAPRLTLTGTAAPDPDPEMRARWLAIHPYAGFYAGLADFTLWRITVTGGHYVGGFARAFRLGADQLRPGPDAVAALAAAEASVIGHVNAEHADALCRIATMLDPSRDPAGWRMVSADADGCDLAQEDHVLRVEWSRSVSDAAGVRTELVRLARAGGEQ